MNHLESTLVLIAYCLAYGAAVIVASLFMYLLCEGLEKALEVMCDE